MSDALSLYLTPILLILAAQLVLSSPDPYWWIHTDPPIGALDFSLPGLRHQHCNPMPAYLEVNPLEHSWFTSKEQANYPDSLYVYMSRQANYPDSLYCPYVLS